MFDFVAQLGALLHVAASDRARLAVENAVLRQQVTVLKRSVKRARIEDGDRIFWIVVRRMIRDWADHLVIVEPETVVRWHRKGFAYYWRRKSRPSGGGGRPPISEEVIEPIKRMSSDNATWGSPRIQKELAKLGHDVAKSTVERYMVRPERGGDATQRWRTFIRNHMAVAAACDFFTVPTLTFKVLYVFVVLSHDRHRILHINVTRHPTAEWTAQQLIEAFPCGDGRGSGNVALAPPVQPRIVQRSMRGSQSTTQMPPGPPADAISGNPRTFQGAPSPPRQLSTTQSRRASVDEDASGEPGSRGSRRPQDAAVAQPVT